MQRFHHFYWSLSVARSSSTDTKTSLSSLGYFYMLTTVLSATRTVSLLCGRNALLVTATNRNECSSCLLLYIMRVAGTVCCLISFTMHLVTVIQDWNDTEQNDQYIADLSLYSGYVFFEDLYFMYPFVCTKDPLQQWDHQKPLW